MYEYPAKVLRIIDGDTFHAEIDLGFHITVRMLCRLAGLNTIELCDPGGPQARAKLASLIEGKTVVLNTIKPDKYEGRFLAFVYVCGIDVCSVMVRTGFAALWDGRGVKKVPSPILDYPPRVAPAAK